VMTDLETLTIRTKPLISAPIVSATDLAGDPAAHCNINGPSLIRVPEWVARPLGRYYLYFADHKGDRIQLAFSNDLSCDWEEWRESEPVEVKRATEDWEGGKLPPLPSVRSAINRPANQLRDPFLFEDSGRPFLVYAVAGEAGLGIATLEISP